MQVFSYKLHIFKLYKCKERQLVLGNYSTILYLNMELVNTGKESFDKCDIIMLEKNRLEVQK